MSASSGSMTVVERRTTLKFTCETVDVNVSGTLIRATNLSALGSARLLGGLLRRLVDGLVDGLVDTLVD